MSGGAAVSYEWAVSADGEEWSVVDTETDETFGVTADLLGMYVKVTVIDDEANVASDVTTEKVVENEDFGVIDITSAEATAANKIEVTLANPVISTDTTITVAKGTNEIAVTASWADTFDSVSLTTPTNMSEGTYTVTLTSTEDPTNTDSATFEVEGQKIAEIVILNEVALTNKDAIGGKGEHEIAYAYYDVLDQYGESVRTSASITWSGSADVNANKATGLIQLTKSDNKAWVYGDKIYLTGVYTKTGVATTAELTVGTEQALDSIEVAGFVKKNTTDLKSTLPADFKSGEWFLLFNAYDQNGNLISAGGLSDDDISIISDNVLVVKEVKGVEENTITIKDVEYNAIGVAPGIKVSDGGAVKFTAIATRTGNKTEYNCVVGIDQVIVSFTMSAPATTVADGEYVEIPFVALDEEGNQVTDFVTIAKQETFNALSLNVGGNGQLILKEGDDGEAVLIYSDRDDVGDPLVDWDDSEATDGIDRPVSLTAVVLGGGTDNQMIQISDKARPDAIKAVPGINDVYVEGDDVPLLLAADNISFYDQYGRDMDALADDGVITAFDNDFFGATEYKGGNDFKGYTFSVKATYSGNGGLYAGDGVPYVAGINTLLSSGTAKTGWVLANGGNLVDDMGFGALAGDNHAVAYTTEDVESSRTNEGFKFEIVKVKTTEKNNYEKYEVVSRAKSATFTVVDIKKVKNFTVDDLGTLYVGPDGTYTGVGAIKPGNADANITTLSGTTTTFTAGTTGGICVAGDYRKDVVVTGVYNGSEVEIPADYYTSTGKKVEITANVTTGVVGYNATTAPDGLTIQDLYDKTTARGTSKLAEDTVTATVSDIYQNATLANDLLPSSITSVTYKSVLAVDDESLTPATGFNADDLDFNLAIGSTYGEALAIVTEEIATLQTYGNYDANGTWTDANSYKVLELGNDDAKAALATAVDGKLEAAWTALNALKTTLTNHIAGTAIEDVATASTKVFLSDQAPKPTAFDGLAASYTFNPNGTAYTSADVNTKLTKVKVVDQYGVQFKKDATPIKIAQITKKVSNIEENTVRYVEGNFTVEDNNKTTLGIVGAELGDTFDLTLSYGDLEDTIPVTIGADLLSYIDQNGNMYLDDADGLLPILEGQRKAILGI